ncbi:MAG: hypothetical protein IT369_21695, partial [Candidatus Latescibacteria bacterium]|nr:hypothetical protein [Candidatus Latescibacterota bacterium]
MGRALGAFAAGLILLLAGPALAHNGSIAVAVPVAGITLDGDFSDWPDGLTSYPITLPEYGDLPQSPADLHAAFRIGYNAAQNALYLALEVQDESVVLARSGGNWNNQDGCDFYLDIDHLGLDSPVRQYALWGNVLNFFGSQGTLGRPEDIQLVQQRSAHGRQYEARLDVGAVSGGRVALRPGLILGLDVSVSDKDEDGSYSWLSWGRGVSKNFFPDRRGDVLLVATGTPQAPLKGRIAWEDTRTGIKRGKAQIMPVGTEGFPLIANADVAGQFAVDLPAGAYRIQLAGEEAGASSQLIQVKPGSQTNTEILAPLVRGEVIAAGPGRTAQAGPGLRQGLWQTFGIPDGLPSLSINAIYQDHQGALWFATRAGVSRYDGKEFTTFSREDGLLDNVFTAFLEDRQGRLWIATVDHGVSCYDGRSFTNYTTQDGLVDNQVSSLLEDRHGNLWIGTGRGLSCYDGKHLTNFTTEDGLPGGGILAMLEDQQGRLWFAVGLLGGISGKGVSCYDGERFTNFSTRDGLADDNVFAMAEGARGEIFFATAKGVSRFEGEHFSPLSLPAGPEYPMVKSLLRDSRGHLWFALWDSSSQKTGGISRYDGQRLDHFTAEDGLASNEVPSIFEDREGYMWFGTSGGGLSRYDGERVTLLTTANGLVGDDVRALMEDRQGRIWMATTGGVSQWDGHRFTNYTSRDGLADDVGRALREDRPGRSWMAT